MIAVIFEVVPLADKKQQYLNLAASLKEELVNIPGFISIERFQSLTDPEKILSLSFWLNEDSVAKWRNVEHHRQAQAIGRQVIFKDYRLRIGEIVRDYGMFDREQAPIDSREKHDLQ